MIEASSAFCFPWDTPSLAQDLYASGDYYRAITEYKRESFFARGSQRERWSAFRIGESYRKSGRAQSAVSYLSNAAWFGAPDALTDSCVLSLARCYIELESFNLARSILDSLSTDDPVKPALKGWSLLLEGDYENARAIFLSSGRDSLADLALECQNVPLKSPRAAVLMSAVVPGAGQVYAGSYRQGIVSFLLNGLMGYLTYRAIDDQRYFEAAAFAYTGLSRFYVGNLVSASGLAQRRNQAALEELLKRGRKEYGGDLK